MPATWFRIALFNLLIAATLGSLMRYAFVDGLNWVKYMNIMYAHSHVALMGWGYLALFSLLCDTFFSYKQLNTPKYKILFWLTQFTVFGMLVSFPIQGYGPVSIAFSASLLILAYIFIWSLYKKLGRVENISPAARKFLKGSLIFFVVSTIGVWSMGPISMFGYEHEAIYYMAIQFFLHFQINGWFIYALLGLTIHMLDQKGITIDARSWRRIFYLLTLATILTFALAVSWSNPSTIVFLVNGVGVIIQLIAVILLAKELFSIRHIIREVLSDWIYRILRIAFLCFSLKVLIQTSVILPPVAVVAYTIRNYVIGFLHLILLGMLTHFLLAEGFRRGYLPVMKKWAKYGLYIFTSGFLITETLLFLQGTLFWAKLGFLPEYYLILFIATLLLPIGIFAMWVSRYVPSIR